MAGALLRQDSKQSGDLHVQGQSQATQHLSDETLLERHPARWQSSRCPMSLSGVSMRSHLLCCTLRTYFLTAFCPVREHAAHCTCSCTTLELCLSDVD